MSGYALYNGVKLPTIPEDVLAQYPYCWIRNNTTSGNYDLLFAKYPWYYTNKAIACSGGNSATIWWYTITISTANDAIAWTFNETVTGNSFTLGANSVLWSNHDIPNGSADATDIYFEGTEPEEPEATATVITYNGSTIATLEAGQTATIKTAETEVEHDIIIIPVFPIEIAYGDIIATAVAGQTATVKCANTEADFDIVVSAKAEEDDSIVGTWVFDKGTVNYDLFIAEAEGVTDKQIPLLYSASNTVSPVLGRIDNVDILYGNYGVFNTCIQYKISNQWLQFVVSNDGATATGVITAPVEYAQGKTWTFYDTCNDADIIVHPVLLEWLKTFATKQ